VIPGSDLVRQATRPWPRLETRLGIFQHVEVLEVHRKLDLHDLRAANDLTQDPPSGDEHIRTRIEDRVRIDCPQPRIGLLDDVIDIAGQPRATSP